MKKVFKIAGVIVACLFFFGIFVSIFHSCESCNKNEAPPQSSTGGNVEEEEGNEGTDAPSDEEQTTFLITYAAIIDGETTDIPDGMYVSGRNYPTSYVEGKSATVDDLRATYNVDSYTDYTFKGWYLDEECTKAFESITADFTGDVTLYAKISVGYWTKNY